MYRCNVCGKCSEPRQNRLLHIVYREKPLIKVISGKRIETTRREIAQEIPVCKGCHWLLSLGLSIQHIRASLPDAESTDLILNYTTNPNYGLPLCDICSEPIRDGQVTADSAICSKHLPRE